MICEVFFALLMTCTRADTPSPEPTPSVQERKESSTDGKSMWEWRWEQMTGEEFVRDPLSPEEIAAREEQKNAPKDGRFIFIPNER